MVQRISLGRGRNGRGEVQNWTREHKYLGKTSAEDADNATVAGALCTDLDVRGELGSPDHWEKIHVITQKENYGHKLILYKRTSIFEQKIHL